MRAALAYAERLRAWLDPLQAELMSTAKSSRHLKRDATRGDPHGRLRIITHEYVKRIPVHVIEATANEVSAQNAADLERVGRVIGIRMSAIVPHDKLAEFRSANIARITSIAEDQLSDVEATLAEAEEKGWHVDALASALQDRFDVTDSKANFIARDQILKLNGEITETRQVASGITRYIWTTSGDERVRPIHAELDGTEHAWSDPPETTDDGDLNNPGGDFQCRCIAYPVIE